MCFNPSSGKHDVLASDVSAVGFVWSVQRFDFIRRPRLVFLMTGWLFKVIS